MKRHYYIVILAIVIFGVLQGCGEKDAKEAALTSEMAYQGVDAYCRETYDWSAAENDPDIMYVTMGEETESEYQVIFRSYTGAFVDFYVDKASGETRMVERVPNLGVEEDAGGINIYDYLQQTKP